MMRTTVTLDDDLVAEAGRLAGEQRTSTLLERALRELIAIESARRLARLGGTDPDAGVAPRRRSA